VRYRAKPFTVEVRRNNKRMPFTAIPADSFPNERFQQADQLLFGGLPSLAKPTEPAGLPKGGSRSTEKAGLKPQAPTAEAVTSESHAESGRVRPTGRVLPDLLEQSRAELRLRQELEQREVRVRAQRSVNRPSSGSRPERVKMQTGAEAHAERKAVLDSAPTARASLKEPLLAAVEVVAPAAVEPITASGLRRPHGSQQRTETARGKSMRRANQAGGHRSERREAYVLLRAGEKWKRRLPRVCW
jgi:hypothetical protein